MRRDRTRGGAFLFEEDWAAKVLPPDPEYLVAFNNGDCLIEYWTPRAIDNQKPHDRDEVYIITKGCSEFDIEGDSRSVAAGDLIFVPAGAQHRFFNFTDNFAMWIVFFGTRFPEFDPTP